MLIIELLIQSKDVSKKNDFSVENMNYQERPIVKSRFKKLQETGLKAELFLMLDYMSAAMTMNQRQ